jgi:hypothetical protein
MAQMIKKTYLRRDKAAAYLQERYGAYTRGTLAKLAWEGGGPQFQKIGPFPLYIPEDLDAWAVGRMTRSVRSTSELSRLSEDATSISLHASSEKV